MLKLYSFTRCITLGLLLFVLAGAYGQSAATGFTIQTAHPRLWFNTDRLAKAKTFYAASPGSVPTNQDPIGNAYRYVMTGQANYATAAINWLVAKQLPAGQVLPTAIGCDECRYYGEAAALVYDWCYDKMTPTQRSEILTRWNKYFSDVNKQEWGGIGMEGNNYYLGNFRNSLLWGIATFHENAEAQSFLDHSLDTRWNKSFIPYLNTAGRGGAPGEGPEYGSTMLAYPLIPLMSAKILGRDMLNETNFFKEALFHTIYSTVPSPMVKGNSSYYGFFPYNETAIDDLLHERTYFGDVMTTLADYYSEIPAGQYARQWLSMTTASTYNIFKSVDRGSASKSFNDLPLDYYASGLGILYGRTAWNTNATAFQAQMKDARGVGHAHFDYGAFQLYRKGRWLTRESSGYYKFIKDINPSEPDTEISNAEGHNTLFVGVQGNMWSMVTSQYYLSPPNVTRLESRDNYVYASVDLTGSFQTEKAELNNPNVAGDVVREYIFIRPMETLVVFDRVRSKSNGTVSANAVLKTALVHFEVNPVVSSNPNKASATIGNQIIDVKTLVPSNPAYKTVLEGSDKGQFRLEITTSGQEQSYFINVLNGHDTGTPELTASVTEDANFFHVSLQHPTLGNAKIDLKKGAKSQGGAIAYVNSGDPSPFRDFTSKVAGMIVTSNGPVWDNDGVITAIEDEKGPLVDALMVYPNPSNSIVTISYQLPGETMSSVSVKIYDARGQLVKTMEVPVSSNGIYKAEWDVSGQPAGIYSVVVSSGSGRATKRVVVSENQRK
jgi:Secretion system C-terminal sorting domain